MLDLYMYMYMYMCLWDVALYSFSLSLFPLAIRDFDNQTQIIIFNSTDPSSTMCVNTTVLGDFVIEGKESYLVSFFPHFPVNQTSSELTTKVIIDDNDGK